MGCNTEMKICSCCEHARGPTVTLLTVLKRRARSTAKPQFSNIIMVDTVIATPEQLHAAHQHNISTNSFAEKSHFSTSKDRN